MVWKPKVIEGGRSEAQEQGSNERRPKRSAPGEAFVLGQGGFSPISKGQGDAMWNFLDLDRKK
ncbi:hypothetical protein K2P56_03585 [Patescibacteria group bacterium]|nr:hypothetical protein [Patescibacteria group bacterium]